MQRRKRRGKLAECVGNGTEGGNDGADRNELVTRPLPDVSGFKFFFVGQTDKWVNMGAPAPLKKGLRQKCLSDLVRPFKILQVQVSCQTT